MVSAAMMAANSSMVAAIGRIVVGAMVQDQITARAIGEVSAMVQGQTAGMVVGDLNVTMPGQISVVGAFRAGQGTSMTGQVARVATGRISGTVTARTAVVATRVVPNGSTAGGTATVMATAVTATNMRASAGSGAPMGQGEITTRGKPAIRAARNARCAEPKTKPARTVGCGRTIDWLKLPYRRYQKKSLPASWRSHY